ncbi:SfnB family sulfur acquisition oxidoreductase [Halomonas sp. SpR8]|uniref:SfnB family sulfur acquisition oxidoreductase n=1 Tax=Halomonas sp. SpR8 TaxID=3050463 RepID=UPI0027E55098|nr:SfnB family sulfur acquisition oxidoreductase [Halomonas sp. SpR8]MDQ7731000.1 SfnB family sulfur acquisition oxidoreductase [Halomonas sp. SpR8]
MTYSPPTISTSAGSLAEPRFIDSSRVKVIRNDAEALETARALSRRFAQDASTRDAERRLPWQELDEFSYSGLGGITVPREYGGADVSYQTIAEVFRLLSTADSALAQIPQNHFGVLGIVKELANTALKELIFGAVLNGQRLGNAGPERGTKTILHQQTRVTGQKGQSFLTLNGSRFYSTGALYAHRIPTRALDGHNRTILAFVPRRASGVEVIDDWSAFGQRITASGTVTFNNVQVPIEHTLPVWQTNDRAGLSGPSSQLIQAAIDAGIAHNAIDDAIQFVREHARPWTDSGVARASDDPYTIHAFGRLKIDLHAANAVLQEAAATLDEIASQPIDDKGSARASVAVAEAKILTTEVALEASERLFELAGASATRAKHNLDRHWRNARTHTLHDPVRWKYHLLGNYYLNDVLPARHQWN